MKQPRNNRVAKRLLLFLVVGLIAVLAVPTLREELVTTPLIVLRAGWELDNAKTAADEKAAIETATKYVRIWSIGPANRDEVAAYVSNQIPKVVLIQWAENNPITGEPYRTTHRLVSPANWSVLENGRITR